MNQKKIMGYKHIILLAVLVAIFFWKPILHPSQLLYSPFSDLTSQDFFWKFVMRDTFEQFGELPLWNPYTFSGMPFLAQHFSKMFYPPNMLFFLTDSVESLFNYFYPLHFFFAGLFMYLFVRRLKLDKFSSFIAAIIYTFNGNYVMYVYAGLPNELPLLVFFPLTLYLLESAFQKDMPVYAVLAGLSISMLILGAHTQKMAYALIFFFVYFLFRLAAIYASARQSRPLFQAAWFFSLAVIIGILVAMVQILPSLEILQYSSRAGGIDYAFASNGSFPPQHLITLAIPNFFGTLLHNDYWSLFPFWNYIIYIGILPLILLLFAFRRKNPYAYFFSATAGLSFLFALGKYTPFHHLLYTSIPLLSDFRAPSRSLFFFIFSLSIVAAFGMSFLLTMRSKADAAYLKKTVIVLGAVLLFGALLFSGLSIFKAEILHKGNILLESKYSQSSLDLLPLEYYQGKIERSFIDMRDGLRTFLIFISLSAATLFLWLNTRISARLFRFLAAAIIIADLWIFSMPFIQTEYPNAVYNQNVLPDSLSSDDSLFRVIDLTRLALPQEITVRYGLQNANGYEGMLLGDYNQYVSAMGGIPPTIATIIPIDRIVYDSMLDLLNVKYLISDEEINGVGYKLIKNQTVLLYTSSEKPLFSDAALEVSSLEHVGEKQIYIYRNMDVLPRAFIAGSYIPSDRTNVFSILESRDFEPKNMLVLESDPGKRANAGFKKADVAFYSPNRIVINASLDSPGFLFLSEVWYPGWKAYDNGRETEIYRADYIFRAAHLEKGTHVVEFVFQPLSYTIGKSISSTVLIVIGIYFVLCFRKRKNGKGIKKRAGNA